ncbi:MAG: carbohydrate-binding domain-containing protein, partial [Ruminococcaceae bacterium]|nr:carbohydrate-binding domain-containing protein [Oscillospiraceae bacterium]
PMGGGNGSITIAGGTVAVEASGDGLDANGTLTVSGGHITVAGPTQGDTATLDYDTSATIGGGTFIGTGADGGMAQTFSDATQGVLAVRVGQQAAGTRITLTDADGNVLLTHTPPLEFAVVILSCPAMESGETYTLTVGTLSAELEAE